MRVAICRYDAGNVRSVELAFRRLGCEVDTDRAADLATADLVVLPGVGSARSAADALRMRGADVALRDRLGAGGAVLGICLGLQLALDWTDEDGGVRGLGLVPGRAVLLTDGRVPRMGWAALDSAADGTYYYAHSYAAHSPATTEWSEGVAVELRWGAFVGCQFHPEKSGPAGVRYLQALLQSLPSALGDPEVDDPAHGEPGRGRSDRGQHVRDQEGALCRSPA